MFFYLYRDDFFFFPKTSCISTSQTGIASIRGSSGDRLRGASPCEKGGGSPFPSAGLCFALLLKGFFLFVRPTDYFNTFSFFFPSSSIVVFPRFLGPLFWRWFVYV